MNLLILHLVMNFHCRNWRLTKKDIYAAVLTEMRRGLFLMNLTNGPNRISFPLYAKIDAMMRCANHKKSEFGFKKKKEKRKTWKRKKIKERKGKKS